MARTRLQYSPSGLPFKQLPASALRACLNEGYNLKLLKADMLSGFLVGILALPLAMALSIAIGLPPQHGLYTSIIAGFITPIIGGSRLNVVGPTAAFIVILSPIVQVFGLPGLLISCLMAGGILILMAILRMGRLIEYIPFPVTTGFTSGISIVIAGLQLKDALGIKGMTSAPHFPEKMMQIWEYRGTFSWGEVVICFLTLGILMLARLPQKVKTFFPSLIVKIPGPLLALPTAAIAAIVIERFFPELNITTLGERFSTLVDGKSIPGIPQTLPSLTWPWNFGDFQSQHLELSLNTFRLLLPSAISIAFLGAIESLLSAVVADGMARNRHEPDSEILALGIANVITPLFGGIPATGAIARTASNFRFGGRTPIAAAIHALTVLLAMLVLAPLLAYLPMSSMAALLLMVAWNMSEIEHFIHTLKIAPKSDSLVLLICFFLTIFFDMVVAVTVGVLLGALFFIRRMASLSKGGFVDPHQHPHLKVRLPKEVVLYSINGPLFFGAAEKAIGALRSIGKDIKVILFMLEDVSAADMTGLVAMEGVVAELKFHGIKTILIGANTNVKSLFIKGGLRPEPDVLAYCDDLNEAIKLSGGKIEQKRSHARGPIRIHPLHRQKTGAIKHPHPHD